MRRFVGRDASLTRLRAVLETGATGDGGVILIAGEPGIGKTRLVAELVAAAPCPVLIGYADQEQGAPPLWPWRQALTGRPERSALESIGATDPGSPAAASMAARAARTVAFDGVLDGLAASAAGAGLVVVLEDVHWADESTLRLLVLAAGRPRLVLVATYRSTEQGPTLRSALTELRRRPGTHTLALRPWTLDDVSALVSPPTHRSWAPVLLRTGSGNPLLVVALLTALVDAGRADTPAPADGSWPLGVPDDLADVTAERLARLDPVARFAVEVAAVTGPGCTPEHVLLPAPDDHCGPPDAATALAGLETAVAAGLLERTGPLRFAPAHALLREAVYVRLSAVRRLRWHTLFADAVESGALPGEAVTHRLRSATDASGRAAAVRACRAAAAAAAGASAFDRAVELLDAALALPGLDPSSRTGLQLQAAEAEFAAGLPDTAVRRCREVSAESTDAAELVRSALVVRGIGGPHNVEVIRLCDVALRNLEPGDRAGRARLLAQRALVTAEAVGWEELDADSAEALRLAQDSGSVDALADALRARQHAVSGPGGLTERLDIARRMIELAGRHGRDDAELWGRLWRVDAAFELGALDVVDTELTQLAGLAERLGWPLAVWHRHRLSAARYLQAGRFDDAVAEADRALAAARGTGDLTAIGVDGAFRSEVHRLRGDHTEMVALLRRAEQMVDVVRMPVFWAQAGLYLYEAGEYDSGRHYLELLRPVVGGLPEDGRWLITLLLTGELAARLGDRRTAELCLTRVTPYAAHYIAGGSGSVRCDGAVSRVLGVLAAALGRDEEAERRLTDAVAMEDRVGAVPYRVCSETSLARLLARRPQARDGARAGRGRGGAGADTQRATGGPAADGAGTRGARPPRPGPDQPPDRGRAGAVRTDRRDPRRARARQARRRQPDRGRGVGRSTRPPAHVSVADRVVPRIPSVPPSGTVVDTTSRRPTEDPMYATLHRTVGATTDDPDPALRLHQIGGPVTLTVRLTPERPADPTAFEVRSDCGLTEPAGVATAAQVLTFSGPISEAADEAAEWAGRERIAPAMDGHPGGVRLLTLWQPELRRKILITLATSLESLEEAGRKISSLPLLPGEDVALLPGPDHVEFFRVEFFRVES